MMTEFYRLDENKNAVPCSLEEWGEQIEKMRKERTKHVADEIVNGLRISTVWLGLNHRLDENIDKPHIFETMVFKDGSDIYCERYSTWQEAEEGHKRVVEWVKDDCKEDKEFDAKAISGLSKVGKC